MDAKILSRDLSVDPELARLLAAARELPPISPAEMREQTISFAYGNLALHNSTITREMVEQAYDQMHPK